MNSYDLGRMVFERNACHVLAVACLCVLSNSANAQEVTPPTLEVGSRSAISQILVEASGTWSVVENVPWLSVSKVSGDGIRNLTITVEANPTASDRVGTIDIGQVTYEVLQRGRNSGLRSFGQWATTDPDNSGIIRSGPLPFRSD